MNINHTTSKIDEYPKQSRNMTTEILPGRDNPREDETTLLFARREEQQLPRSLAARINSGLEHHALLDRGETQDRSSLAFRLELQKQELQCEIQLAELRYRQLQEETLLRQRSGMSASALSREIVPPQEARDLIDPSLALPSRYDSAVFSSVDRDVDRDRLLLLASRNAEYANRGSWMESVFPERADTSNRLATNDTESALLWQRLRQENDMQALLLEERLQRLPLARFRDSIPEGQSAAALPERPTKQARKLKPKESDKGKTDKEMGRMKKKKTPVALEGERPIRGAVTFPLAGANDKDFVSPYQALVRQSLEFFQTSPGDVFSNIHGRNNEIRVGQVGVRCKFCAHRPVHWRGRGCLYFPSRVCGVYQAAQNVANNHLANSCPDLPAGMKEQLDQLRGRSSAKRGGGKKYWEDTCRSLGLCEREGEPGVWLR